MKTQRLIKEFRPLLLPSCVAAGAACIMSLLPVVTWPSAADASRFFVNLSGFAFFGGIAIAAGMVFGAEFQQRTLGLLISQPVERPRLWNEKMLALLLAVTAVSLVLWLSQWFAGLINIHWAMPSPAERILPNSRQDVLLGGACVVATVCSAGFWTLTARSTIGGIVFSVASQFFVALGAIFALQKIYGADLSFEAAPIVTGVIIGAGILYSAVFLWLGRRKFARLELRDVSPGESDFLTGPLAGMRWRSHWLRCRPSGMTLNLIRKELRLHKPVFLIAAILSLCWIATLMLLLLDPPRKEVFDTILNLLTAIYVAVLPLLAGCISLGEEKALGLTAWHLTLPISARRQWLLKLAVSIGVAVGLGFALPYLLAWLTTLITNVGLVALLHGQDNASRNGWAIILSLWGAAFLMSFWAVTLLANTLRAALASIISLVGIYLCCALAALFAVLVGPWETRLLLLPTAYFQLPLDFFVAVEIKYIVPCAIATVVITILTQSLAQFRRAQAPRKIIWKYCAILAGMVFLLSFWLTDFANSADNVFSSFLRQEVSDALASLPIKQSEPSSSTSQSVTLKELEQTGRLSALTKTWLKDASISFVRLHGIRLDSPQTLKATIEFRNGGHSEVYSAQSGFRQKGTTPHGNKTNQPPTEEKP